MEQVTVHIQHYKAFADWVAHHWHNPTALQEAQHILQPFVAQQARDGKRNIPEPWRIYAWTVAAQRQAEGDQQTLHPSALRWLAEAQDAKNLVQSFAEDETLDLSGLTELNIEVATALAEFAGTLDLSGLQNLEPSVAQALANHRGLIRLDGLQRLGGFMTPLTQRRVPRLPGQPSAEQPGLSLRGLVNLTPEEAHYLSYVQGELDLGGLKHVTPALATLLVRNNASTSLPIGWLRLDGWLNPSVESLQALRLYEGPLSLALAADAGLRESLEILSKQKHAGIALPFLQNLTLQHCELLATLKDVKEMHLNGVLAIDRPCAVALSRVEWDELHLNKVLSITPETAAAFVQQNDYGTTLFMDSLQVGPELRPTLQKHIHLDGLLGQRVWSV